MGEIIARCRILVAALFFLIPAVTSSAQGAEDSLAVAGAPWQWTALGRGASLGVVQVEVFGGPQYITVLKYPARRYSTGIFDSRSREAGPTDALALKAGACFAANGSYFSGVHTPTTFFCADGEQTGSTLARELFRIDGILAIKGRGCHKVEIFPVDTNRYDEIRTGSRMAIGAGPLLLQDGAECVLKDRTRFATARNPRTVIGVGKAGKAGCIAAPGDRPGREYVFYVVADGRSAGNAIGITLAQAAALCRWLGCRDAVNFDGGGSSALWTSQTGIVNHPCDNRKWDHDGARRVPNIIFAR